MSKLRRTRKKVTKQPVFSTEVGEMDISNSKGILATMIPEEYDVSDNLYLVLLFIKKFLFI